MDESVPTFDAAAAGLTGDRREIRYADDPPDDLGRYRLGDPIGRGGVGTVYRTYDRALERSVALKVCRPEVARDPEARRRFLAEARIASRLQHPGIVPIYDLGTLDDGRPYFAMRFVDGETLDARLTVEQPWRERAGSEGEHEFVAIFGAVVDAVAHAHGHGVTHGDLKPQNVMLGSAGEVVVVDWGFARCDDPLPAGQRALGTLKYSAPELVGSRGSPDGLRADVFALGAMLCEILTGDPPYRDPVRGVSLELAARGDDEWVARRLARASPELAAIAARCLATDPAARFANGQAVAMALRQFHEVRRERTRRAEVEAVAARERMTGAKKRLALVGTTLASLAIAAVVVVLAVAEQRREEAVRRVTAHGEFARAFEFARSRIEELESGKLADPAEHEVAIADGIARAELAVRMAADPLLGTTERELARTLLADLIGRRADVEQAKRLIRFLDERRPHLRENADFGALGSELAREFEGLGIGIDRPPPADLATRLRATGHFAAIRDALDEWALLRRRERPTDREYERAVVRLLAIVDSDPWRSEVRTAGIEGDLARLRALAADHAVVERQSAESIRLLGLRLVAAGDPESALDLFASASLRHPGDYWLQHDTSILRGDPNDANESSLLNLSMAYAARPDSSHIAIDLANALFARGRIDDAAALARHALANDPGSARAAFLTGSLAVRQGDLEAGIENLERAARGGLHAAPLMLSDVYGRIGRISLAVHHAGLAIAGGSQDPLAWLQCGRVLAEARDFTGALAALDDAVQRAPEDVRALALRAYVLANLGDLERALPALDSAQRRASEGGDSEYRALLATTQSICLQLVTLAEREAAGDLEPFLEWGATLPAEVRMDMGAMLLIAGNPAAAMKLFEGAVDEQTPFGARIDPIHAALRLAATDETRRERLREQALEWLRAEVRGAAGAWNAAGTAQRYELRRVLEILALDPFVRSLREDTAFSATADAASRDAWRALFREFDEVLAR